eukprot:jgi/Mesvir1/27627/Mv07359-RA.1
MRRIKRACCQRSPAQEDSTKSRNKRGRLAGAAAEQYARQHGIALSNSGAGPPPVGADAPYGGTRYTLLGSDAPDTSTRHVGPHDGKRDKHGKLMFADAREFRPSLTPVECIQRGIFGGCYFNPRGGKKGIFGRVVKIDHKEFPKDWFAGLPEAMYVSRKYHVPTNKYGVKAGETQAFWESKGWIHQQDPRGWFQWYCRFYQGRRTDDDERQIKRWAACAGDKGRWRNQLCNKVVAAGKSFDDATVSPVIRQTLLHWAYELTEHDMKMWKARKRLT